jgi:[acyl-carrier-protein] S-malonyltransferase
MNGRLMLLCPGQGAQDAAMFDMARQDPRAGAFVDACATEAGATDIFANQVAQPLIVAATLAMWQALAPRMPVPVLTAGYSIGEVAAHAVAGALDSAEAVSLARERARLMDQAALTHPGQAMASAGGLPLARTRQLAGQHGLHVAIVTGEDTCIVAGDGDGIAALESEMLAAGGRYQRLPVAVASHTPLMAAAVAPFAARLESASYRSYACPVLSGIDASRVLDKQRAVEHLSRQLAEPILWSACMDAALEAGVTVALELGPGSSLSRMLRGRHPGIACRSVSEFRTLDGIICWLERQAL